MSQFAISSGLQRLGWPVFGLLILLAGVALTHEGHAPLPSKGVEVDPIKGWITLSPTAQKSLALQTAQAELKQVRQTKLAYATITTPWQQQYFVSSQLSGRLAQVHVNSGQRVERGQLLAEVESPELEGLLRQLREAANNLDLASRQFDRLAGLDQQQIVNGREFLEVGMQLEQFRSAVQISTAKLLSLGIDPARLESLLNSAQDDLQPLTLPLFSPHRGTVSHSDLAVGKVIAANEHLFEINDVSKLWVAIGVLENDLPHVRSGQEVDLEFNAFPGEKFTARISVTGNYIDPQTHVATVWTELDNPGEEARFLPGMHGTARIVVSEPAQLLTVPTAAVLGSGAERYVLVEMASTRKGYEYRRQNVVVASQGASHTQLQPGGLFPGDRVVTRGGHVLSSFFFLGSLRLSPEGIRNVGLKMDPVRRVSVEQVLEFDGTIDLPPGGVSTISTQVPGTLQRVWVDRGERVSEGQVVAEVSGLPVLDAQLELLQADREATYWETTLARFRAPGDSQLLATRQIWELDSKRSAAVIRRDAAQQTLLALGLTRTEISDIQRSGQPLPALPIRSPITGVVMRLNKVLGEGVAADEALIEVHDLARIWAQGYVSERDAGQIRVGMPARVRLLNEEAPPLAGHVARTARYLGDEDRSLSIWVEFHEPPVRTVQKNRLAVISATLNVPEPTLAVPHSAISREGIRTYVFVQQPDGLLERRPVSLGRADDRWIEVTRGLQTGEMIAVQGVSELATTFAAVR